MFPRLATRIAATGALTALPVITMLSCSSDRPLAPRDAPLVLQADEIAGFMSALDDARLRIVPGLGNASDARQLGVALEALSAAVQRADGAAAGERLVQVQRALERAGAAGTTLDPDRDAIRLVLQRVAGSN